MAVETQVKRASIFNPVTGKTEMTDVGSQPILPVQPGEREALINKYVAGGYSLPDAIKRVTELQSGRPQVTGTTPPRSFVFAPTSETLSTQMPIAQKINPADSYMAAVTELLKKAQMGSGNEDLLKQRNALVNQRFNAVNEQTPEELQVLSPGQQAALRSGSASGIQDQLGGVDAAITARNTANQQGLQALGVFASLLKASQPVEKAKPASIQEYEYAKEQDPTIGTYTEWSKGQMNAKYEAAAKYQKTNTDAALRQLRSEFVNSPTVKAFNEVQAAYNVALSIPNNTNNPQLDTTLINTLAKAQDPARFLRAEQTGTVGEYANSVLQNFSQDVARIFTATGKLGDPTSRQQIKDAIKVILDGRKIQYDDLKRQTEASIAAVHAGGMAPLTDLSMGAGATGAPEETQPEDIQSDMESDAAEMGLTNTSDGLSIAIPPQVGGKRNLAFVNNNPGNLRFVGQAGAVQGTGGFARFSSPVAGFNALKNQIKLDASRGKTLAQFIYKYAPPIENNTSLYLSQMERALGVSQNTPISQIPTHMLAAAIARKESQTRVTV